VTYQLLYLVNILSLSPGIAALALYFPSFRYSQPRGFFKKKTRHRAGFYNRSVRVRDYVIHYRRRTPGGVGQAPSARDKINIP